MNIKKFFEKKNVVDVFHYTSPEGLYSILNNKTLRFTDCQFFNDKSEYIYIKEPLTKAIDQIQGTLKNSHLVESINNWLNEDYESKNKDNDYSKQRYYVFCTSVENDSRSLWNYYIKNGCYQGYNIGISIQKFIEYFRSIDYSKAEMWHGQIVYSLDEQVDLIVKLIQDIDAKLYCIKQEVRYTDYWYSFLQEAQEEIIDTIELYRLFFKNDMFYDEDEYRFVLKLPIDIMDSFRFIQGCQIKNGVLSPYYDLVVDDIIFNLITISPMLEEGLARRGIELLLQSKHHSPIAFKKSNVPIRY